MPAKARCQLVNPDEVELFHCYARCVRRAFLCGVDPLTGNDYNHRKDWIRSQLERLCAIFAIDVGWYAVLDNHLHVVLRTRPDLAARWSDQEVIRRACRLFPFKFAKLGVADGQPTRQQLSVLCRDRKLVQNMRERLSCMSWFMGKLCRHLAVKANEEDGVSGHFFEGRFRSQPILDEAGLLICGVYVDLNWIRAGKAATPEASRYTSAADRIRGRAARGRRALAEAQRCDGWLAPLQLEGDGQRYQPGRRASNKGMLPLTLEQYLQLLDWTGRQLRRGKRGAIPPELPPILERLGLQPSGWLDALAALPRLVQDGHRRYGSAARLRRAAGPTVAARRGSAGRRPRQLAPLSPRPWARVRARRYGHISPSHPQRSTHPAFLSQPELRKTSRRRSRRGCAGAKRPCSSFAEPLRLDRLPP